MQRRPCQFLGMNLTVRTRNILRQMGIENIKQLSELTDRQLLKQHNFGKISFRELVEEAAKIGVTIQRAEMLCPHCGKPVYFRKALASIRSEILSAIEKLRKYSE